MLNLDEYICEYLQLHTDTTTKVALSKITENTRVLRRGVNIAVEDRFRTSYATNPYYRDLQKAGILETELPILADFFEFVAEKDEEFNRVWLSNHRYIGNVRQVRPVLQHWHTLLDAIKHTPDKQ